MQILVEGLRCAVATRVAHAKADVLVGAVSQVGTGREDHLFHHIVLIEATSDDKIHLLTLPLILQIKTSRADGLLDGAAKAHRVVIQVVIRILKSDGKLRRQEEALLEDVAILRTGNQRKVLSLAIGIGVFARAVVAVAADALGRGVEIYEVARVGREVVPAEATTIDVVIDLLGDLGHMGREVDIIATATELADVVILGGELRVCRSLIITSKTERTREHTRQIGEAVVVAVVGITILDHTKEIDSGAAVVRNKRAIERGIELCIAALHNIGRMAQLERVAQRLLGDDIHNATDSVRAEECRAATANNLNALDHSHGQLLKAIDTRQRREDRARIEKYLRILTIQTVDTELHRTAVAAGVLDAQARL